MSNMEEVAALVVVIEADCATPTPSAAGAGAEAGSQGTDADVAMPFHLEQETIDNTAFRRVVRTGKYQQLVLMALRPGQEIGREVHPETDQFFRVEQGTATIELGDSLEPNESDERVVLEAGDSLTVPAGTFHNVSNTTDQDDDPADLKLYTIYAPPQHPVGTVLFK
jgi:mannose-6-phosphate isomerase-like protein (cupin superfamily)